MRYPLILLGVLSLASCAPTTTSPTKTQEQPKAPAEPAKPTIDYSKLSYDAPEWEKYSGSTCFINDFSMDYRTNTFNLRRRVIDFNPGVTDKSTAILIFNSIVNSYKDIDTTLIGDLKRLGGDGVLTSSNCVQRINSTIRIRNAAIFDRDPIERQYKAEMNKVNTLYDVSISAIAYARFYVNLLTSIEIRLKELRSSIDSM